MNDTPSQENSSTEEDQAETWMYDLPENTDQGTGVVSYDVTSSPNDFNVTTLMSFIDKGSIVIPRYQRNYVWDKKRASRLIESLVLGLPIPQLFLYQEDKNKFSILDGQQRLLTIYFFYKMRFPRPGQRSLLREKYGEFNKFAQETLSDNQYFSDFSLFFGRDEAGQRNPLQGLNYDTLGEHQIELDLRTIRCVIIKQNDPDIEDNSSVFEIFDRLNTGGVNLKPQQIRSNIYHGLFYDNLHELNKIEKWRELLGKKNLDDNCRDQELVLRILGMMFYGPDGYQPTMTQFLNRFSNHMKKLENANRQAEVSLVPTFFEIFLKKLNEGHFKEFYSDGRFSIGTAESVFFAATKTAWERKDTSEVLDFSPAQVKEISDKIRPFLLEGSAQLKNVRGRLELAETVIK